MSGVLRATLVLAAAIAAAAPAAPQSTPAAARGATETLAVPVYPGQTVTALLTIPALEEPPWPAVLMIAVRRPGAAPAPAMLALTDALLARGIAVVRLDVPPTADVPAGAEPLVQPADDAYAVIQFVRAREDVDGDRIGILGLDDAAPHAARAAALDEATRGLVLLGAESVERASLDLPDELPLLSLPLDVRATPARRGATTPVDEAAAFLARHLQ